RLGALIVPLTSGAPAARRLLGGGGFAGGALGRGLRGGRRELPRLHREVDDEGGGAAFAAAGGLPALGAFGLALLLLLLLLLASAAVVPAAAGAAPPAAPAARTSPAAPAARLRLLAAVEVELLLDVRLGLVVGDALLGGVGEGVAGLVARHRLAGDGEELGEVLREVGEVEEGVLLLADVHERRLDGGHDLADAAEVDVAEGADVIRVFDVQLDQLAVLDDGDARAVLARVDDDLFLHEGWEGAQARGRGPGGRRGGAGRGRRLRRRAPRAGRRAGPRQGAPPPANRPRGRPPSGRARGGCTKRGASRRCGSRGVGGAARRSPEAGRAARTVGRLAAGSGSRERAGVGRLKGSH